MTVYSNSEQCVYYFIQHWMNVPNYRSNLKSLTIKEYSFWMFVCKADEISHNLRNHSKHCLLD